MDSRNDNQPPRRYPTALDTLGRRMTWRVRSPMWNFIMFLLYLSPSLGRMRRGEGLRTCCIVHLGISSARHCWVSYALFPLPSPLDFSFAFDSRAVIIYRILCNLVLVRAPASLHYWQHWRSFILFSFPVLSPFFLRLVCCLDSVLTA